MTVPIVFSIHAWFGSRCNGTAPAPPKHVVDRMLAQMQAICDGRDLKPIAPPITETWTRPEGVTPTKDNDFLASITVTADSGRLVRSLACWFQWQHPRWTWSQSPFPSSKLIEGGA